MNGTASTQPVAITMGDPAGVGPEVIMGALSALSPDERQGIVVVGSRAVLERAGRVVGSQLTVGLRGQSGKGGFVKNSQVGQYFTVHLDLCFFQPIHEGAVL